METNTVIYYCTRCGLLQEAPAGTPMWCCGEMMERVENQAAARRLMKQI